LRAINLFSAFMLAAGFAVAQSQPLKDFKDFKDPELFTRMPGYFLSYSGAFKEIQFDAYKFRVLKGTSVVQESVEGHLRQYYYNFDASGGKVAPSHLQVRRNYQNAAVKSGGKVLWEEDRGYYGSTFLLTKDGKQAWVEFKTSGSSDGICDRYYLTIVEREAMQQDVVANAEALKGGLAERGHVEVSGILFDFNKAEIKPESKPALAEITKLLQANPSLRVWVVGHTDNVGTADANLKLSSARAAAVAAALVQSGIDVKRLSAFGAGPYAPVVANTTDEGRAKNRRVELVTQP
jgi:outer membrane protein OmpA-like peptidoglycan-associated protein